MVRMIKLSLQQGPQSISRNERALTFFLGGGGGAKNAINQENCGFLYGFMYIFEIIRGI